VTCGRAERSRCAGLREHSLSGGTKLREADWPSSKMERLAQNLAHHDALEFADGQFVLLTHLKNAREPLFFSYQQRPLPRSHDEWPALSTTIAR
jgi:hypothetical protein